MKGSTNLFIDPASRHFARAATSPVRTAPHHSELNQEVAAEIRLLATALLKQSGALYLTITADTRQGRTAPSIRCHDGFRKTVEPQTSEGDRLCRLLKKVSLPIIEKLASSWPPNARPRRIGFMTDGSGAAFSPDLPCPDIEGWPAMLLDGSARRIDLVPFGAKTIWSSMSVPTRYTH